MTTLCPNGHQSETSDYCDQCGAKISGAPAAPAGPASPSAGPASSPAGRVGAAASGPASGGDGQPCPVCATPRVGEDRFCEGCGFDFTTGAPASSNPIEGETGEPAWEAIVTADHDYYLRVSPADVPFPPHCPPRHFLLQGDQLRIGRRSSSRGVQAEVDLSGSPEDMAISHLHGLLIEQPDGSYALIDPGSTNGTTLNDDPTPLTANVPVPLADGDRIHIGAWTTITVQARPPAAPASG